MSWRNQPRDSKGRWTTGAGLGVLALVLGLGVAAGGGGLGGAAGAGAGGPGSSVTTGSGGTGSSGARTPRARDRDQDGVARRLARSGREVRRIDGSVGTDCAAVSYGRVRVFFLDRPCTAVGRGYFEVRQGPARAVVAVAVVDMPDDAGARDLRALVDTHGTGNVRELRTPRGVRWTGRYYRSTRDDGTVLNVQAEPAGPGAAAARLAAGAVRDAATG